MKRTGLIWMMMLIVLSLFAFEAIAQTTVKGKVIDAETKEPIIGAVVICGESGVQTDENGSFSIEFPVSSKAVIRYIGYEVYSFTTPKSGVKDLGIVELKSESIGLQEVSIIASIVPKDRVTPIPVSNITSEMIQQAAPNIEFPELLKTTPSVYVTKGGGGYGDSRINMRGFDSNNLGILINGVPINDMENGKVYWSNWAGLNDVSSFIQVQRGLGASKLGLSSVGGTMNMVTKSTDARKGGSFYSGIGNDGYNKFSFNVSTGLLSNGWAITLSGARTSGDGYIRGTNFLGWSYFVNVSKMINDRHRLSFTAFGAPQWHNQRGTMHYIDDYRGSMYGARYNNSYGILNGEITGGGYAYNEYHKPQISLNHYWNISDKSTLYTTAYVSIARGGGRRVRGSASRWLDIDYQTGRPRDPSLIKLTPGGLLDFDAVMAENKVSVRGSQAIFTTAVNSHNWYGVLSSFRHNLNDHLSFTGGFDGRYYKGIHFEQISDLLGGDYYIETNPFKRLIYNDPKQLLKVGDKVEYDNTGEVLWTGLFAQTEYNGERFTGFISAALTHEAYRYDNRGGTGEPEKGKDRYVSDWATFMPWSVKGGLSYRVSREHELFANAGYFTRAPFFRNVFFNYNTVINKGAKYEKVLTAEAGYKFRNEAFSLDLNGYYTRWMDKSITRSLGGQRANIAGLDAVHMGVEAEATYRLTRKFELKAMASIGDWRWADDVDFILYDDAQNKIGEYHAYVKDVHVGNSAQLTASLRGSYEILPKLRLRATYTFAGKNYADFDPTNRTSAEDAVDAWKMPNYYTLDLGMSYRFDIGKLRATLYLNGNNVTNVAYFADAKDGIAHDAHTSLVYYGFGRTWSTGLRINF